MRARLRWPALVPAVVLALLATAATDAAEASAPIYSFQIGPSSTQGGGHPDVYTDFDIGDNHTQPPVPCNCNNPKDIIVNTPPGLVGTPSDIPQCTAAEFGINECPVDTQVGLTVFKDFGGFSPLYNLAPRPGQLALFGTTTPTPPPFPIVFTSVTVRTESDYGLEFDTIGLPSIGLGDVAQLLWGVPADPIHDALRFPFGALRTALWCAGGVDVTGKLRAGEFPTNECVGYNYEGNAQGTDYTKFFPPDTLTPSNSPAVPFTSNPTACGGVLSATIETLAFDLNTEHADAAYPAITGCDQLGFNPSLSAKPTTTEADSPSGLDVDLSVPQTLSATTPTPSAIRATTITLPPGFTIDAGAADGKSACTAAEANFGSRDPAQCPEFSKIGTLAVTSSSFPTVLPGAMYLGEPLPGNRYRVFLVFDGFSIHVKLVGTATPDPATGQLTVSFQDLPQFTFQEFNLHVFGAERGLLATPTQCGTYPVKTTFTPWAFPAIPEQTSTQFFTVDSGPSGSPCPPSTRPFDPAFQAGVADNTAGAHSPFAVQLTRGDGEQNVTGLNVTTPPGFSATLKGIPYCPESAIAQLADSSYSGLSEQASSACPTASQVGTVTAGAGAGTHPLYAPGKAYLAGPYKGAPLSLEVVIPAVSGPYDLGNVAVRVALDVDPTTAQVTAVSDPLPQIVGGIPLRTRSITIGLDRKDFVLNPTNCDPFSIDATAFGDQGSQAPLSSHFQVANCADLGFSPKLGLRLAGPTTRNGHPAVHATLSYTENQANVKSVSVTLPRTEQLDSTHIGGACTTPQFDAGQCPTNSILGTAQASTPLLDQPLKGNVYLVTAGNRLPDIVLALRGQFAANVHGIVDTAANGGLRTTFNTVPDVPLSSFRLDLAGGKVGLVVNNTDTCVHRRPAIALIDGQNGRTADQKVALNPTCGKAHKRHKRHHRQHSRAVHHARKAG